MCKTTFPSALSDADTKVPAPVKCGLGSIPCKDGRGCVLYRHRCDAEEDCLDGSDEDDCAVQCVPGQFQCAHGRMCIDQSEVCDGTAQCQDQSDESDCWVPTESCFLRCDKSRCIAKAFHCDGERDCLDGMDEQGCADVECASSEFQCASGQCVPWSVHCDGHTDCRDFSDEKNCDSSACPSQQRCSNGGQCLLAVWVCDGEDDCEDGSDEKDCQVPQVTCRAFQWTCASETQCVPMSWRCDGHEDCRDSSDEVGCTPAQCPPHQFQCGTGECVDPASVCNGTPDCSDDSDEGLACDTAVCSSPDAPPCGHNCYSTPKGPKCSCNVGFQLQADQVTCVDSDECKATASPCSHLCVNTQGSYTCHCHQGYQLTADGRGCEITGEPLLLTAMQDKLHLLGLRSSSLDVISTTSKKAIMWVDYDWQDQKIYWVNLDAESVKWNSLDKKDKGTIVKGVNSDCMAVDWVGRNLYWIDGVRGWINAVTLDATTMVQNFTVVVDKDLEQPRCLVLMPQNGTMFWSEIGEPRIERAGMDGSDRRIVVQENLSWPGSLAVDYLGGRIYWSDERLQCIGSATLDGRDVKLLQMMEITRPFSVVVFEDMIYWSDTERRSVQRANKHTGRNRETLLKQTAQPLGVKVIHKLLQETMLNPCQKLRCSHICLLAPGPKGVCHCPSGLQLAQDGLTCSELQDSAFIFILSPTSITQLSLQSLPIQVGLANWPEHHVMALPGIGEATALEYVQWNHSLYVSDLSRGSVEAFLLREGELWQSHSVVQLQGNDAVTMLSVDWVTLNLYWSSRRQPQLHVTSGCGTYTAVLLDDLKVPTAVALYPPAGWLCFTDLGWLAHKGHSQVECAYMDGHNHSVVWKAQKPISIAFSPDGTRLYWADAGAGVIGSIGIDGSGYKEFEAGGSLINALTCSDSMLFWVTVDDETTKVWFHDGTKAKQLWFEVKANIVSLKAYSKSVQEGTNLCSNGNGGCHHLCLPFPGGRTCRCANSYHSVSETDCMPATPCPPDAKACQDGLTCLPTRKFCDGHPDCPDQSDENCTADQIRPRAPPTFLTTSQPILSTALNDVLQRELEAVPCDTELCHGHGRCVPVPGGGTACECHPNFVGEFCQDLSGLPMPMMLAYVGGALVALVVASAIVLVIRRTRMSKRRERVITKETAQTEMVTRVEQPLTEASACLDAYSPEDLSPVD